MDWLLDEIEAIASGYDIVCGVDEAGRGPLAGPVYAAAVVLKKGQTIEGVNDSKKLSEKNREELFEKIVSECSSLSVGWRSVRDIVEIYILQATFFECKSAVEAFIVKLVFELG